MEEENIISHGNFDFTFRNNSWLMKSKKEKHFVRKPQPELIEFYGLETPESATPKRNFPSSSYPIKWANKNPNHITPLADGRSQKMEGVKGVFPSKVSQLAYKYIDSTRSDDGVVAEMKKEFQSMFPSANELGSATDNRQYYKDAINHRVEIPEEDRPLDDVAWKKYLGLNYDKTDIVKSQYQPSKSIHPNAEYYTLGKNYFNKQVIVDAHRDMKLGDSRVTNFEEVGAEIYNQDEAAVHLRPILDPLQNFTVGRGQDEKGQYLSIYDKYDLKSNPMEGYIGEPFEIYDRFYFNEATGLVNKSRRIKALNNQISKNK